MAYKNDSKGKEVRRVVSPTETERLLGFPTDWTKPDKKSHKDPECRAVQRNVETQSETLSLCR